MTDIVANFELQPEKEIEATFTLTGGTIYHDQLLHRDYANQHPISAITDLQDNLDTLQANIDSESVAREEADEALGLRITNVVNGTTNIEYDNSVSGLEATTVKSALDELQSNIETSESTLQSNLDAEEQARIDADNTLQANITAEETRAKGVEDTLRADLTTETSNRISADDTLQSNIDSEKSRAESAESTLQANITAEETRARTAEQALSSDLASEAQTRETDDNTLQANIDAEALARQNADEALQSNIDTEALAREADDTALNTKIDTHIADKSNPHEVTKAQVGLGNVDNTADLDKPISTATQAALDVLTSDVATINSKIPSSASGTNKLTDTDFVNSSIATNTANFIGTFDSLADLEAYTGEVTNNDYAFVIITDELGNSSYNRYKWTVSTDPAGWAFEFTLNNSSFTQGQWNTINSGLTANDVAQISTNQTDIATINTTIGGYGDIVTHNVSEFATSTQGAKADTAVQPSDLASVATSGSYDDLSDKPTIGNATLTIQKNGTDVDTFTANATADKTINITVPTDTNDLTNGAGYITGITSSDVSDALGYAPVNPSNLATVATSGDYTDLSNKPTIGDGTLTIQANGTSVATFSANQTTNTTANITIPDPLPSQTGQSGKFLTTDGTDASWENVDALPSQTGQAGKFLTTNGTDASWQAVSVNPDNKSITTNSSSQLQTIGVIDQNNTSSAVKLWTGTGDEYAEIGTYFAYANGDSLVYVRKVEPAVGDTVYSGIGTVSSLSITAIGTKSITLSDGLTYDRSGGDLVDDSLYDDDCEYVTSDDDMPTVQQMMDFDSRLTNIEAQISALVEKLGGVRLMVDYENSVAITSPFTAPSDGFVSFNYEGANPTINGVTFIVSGNDSYNEGPCSLPVNEGDVITYNGHNPRFVPWTIKLGV